MVIENVSTLDLNWLIDDLSLSLSHLHKTQEQETENEVRKKEKKRKKEPVRKRRQIFRDADYFEESSRGTLEDKYLLDSVLCSFLNLGF